MDVKATFEVGEQGALFAIRSGDTLVGTLYVTPTGIEWYRRWPDKKADDSLTWTQIVESGHRMSWTALSSPPVVRPIWSI